MNEPSRSLALVALSFIVILGLMSFGFGSLVEGRNNPNQHIEAGASGPSEVVLEANPAGQYLVPGTINGRRVTFLIDTGATHVAVPAHVAERIGLERGRDIRVQTAAGQTTASSAVLSRVTIGGITRREVRGSINPSMTDDYVLLGMSFLRHLALRQQGEQLILRQTGG